MKSEVPVYIPNTNTERRFTMRNLGKTIAKHRKEHKLKQSQLADRLTSYDIFVKPNTVSAWESGLSLPSSKQLLAICEILNIYDIYTEFIGTNPDNPFRNLNKEGIDKVMEYTYLLEKSGDYKTAEIIPINVIRERKVYFAAVSAGNGSFLDGEDYEMHASADIPEKADFGVHVSGDGNAYVKKFQNNKKGAYLVSLNKKYAPMPITENSSFKIFGRVLTG